MDLLLCMVLVSLLTGSRRLKEIRAPHGWTVDQLLKLHVYLKRFDQLLQDSNDITHVLGPRLPRIYCSVLSGTTNPNPNLSSHHMPQCHPTCVQQAFSLIGIRGKTYSCPLTSSSMGVLRGQCMELQSAGRLDGAACFHGSLALNASRLNSHRVCAAQGICMPS